MNANGETIGKLIALYRQDEEMLETLEDALQSFQAYHAAIFASEMALRLGKDGATAAELDQERTHCHNALLAQVNLLNRMAQEAGLPPFYQGMVSEDQPYRRQVADAVLSWVEEIIRERN